MFGIGMTLASGCGNRTLVRIGGGNVKSLTVLVVAAVCAYLMMWTPLFERSTTAAHAKQATEPGGGGARHESRRFRGGLAGEGPGKTAPTRNAETARASESRAGSRFETSLRMPCGM